MFFKKTNFFKKYLERAVSEGWAVGQFNVSTFEVAKAVLETAKKMKSPVIIGTSEKESKFLGLKEIAFLVRMFREEMGFPVILHLDHGKDLGYIKESVAAGYDSIHFDGSDLPLKENIERTKEVLTVIRGKNILIEGEVGVVKGGSVLLKEAPEILKKDLTNPEEAEEFLKATKVDILAVNIGSFHGINSVKGKNILNIERLSEIKEKTKNVPLVLHGGSKISEEDISKAKKSGIAKININTELRLGFTQGLKTAFSRNPEEIVPYKYFPEALSEVQKIVEEKIQLFGGANKV